MRQTAAAALLLSLAGAACVPPAGAAPGDPTRAVLLELFTSQGCSSCPRADAFVVELPALGLDRRRVVPLTFHVDYWDGLGWKDPFASPAFTARQRRYADAGGLRAPDGEEGLGGLYTPQMILDGTVHFSGQRRDLALREIRRAGASAPPLALDASAALNGDSVVVTARVTARQEAASREAWRLLAALAIKSARTAVGRGENAGERLQEAAIATRISDPVAVTLPQVAPARIALARPADRPWSDLELVVFVQSATTLRVGAVQSIPMSK